MNARAGRRRSAAGPVAAVLGVAGLLAWALWPSPSAPSDPAPLAPSAQAAAPMDDPPAAPGPLLAGRVTDALSGAGVDGALVQVTCEDAELIEVVTDAEGAFEVPADVGCRASARAEGRVAPGPHAVSRAWTREDQALELRLLRAGTVDVRVSDGRGKPVSAASLTLVHLDVAGEPEVFSVTHDTPTGPQGRARLEAVVPGSLQVLAEHADHGLAESAVVTVEPGETVRVRVRLGGTAVLRGRVVDASGSPVSRAEVRVAHAAGGDARTTRTSDRGSFVLAGLPEGTATVDASAAGHLASLPLDVDLEPEVETSVRLVLERPPDLLGRVLGADGRPVAGAVVEVAPAGGRTRPVFRELVRTAADGRFIVDSVDGFPLLCRARHGSWLPSDPVRVERPGDRLRLVLGGTGIVRGRVVRASNGAPLADATVAVDGRRGRGGARAKTGPSGEFELRGVPARRVSVRVMASGHVMRLVSGLDVPPDGHLDAGEIALNPAGRKRTMEYVGVGATLRRGGDALVLGEIFPGSAAAEAGIAPGTQVLAVDGRSVAALEPSAAVELIRGETGTDVELEVVGPGEASSRLVTLRRRAVRHP